MIFSVLAAAAVAASVVLITADAGPWSGEGSSLAKRACGDSRAGLEEYTSGERTQQSALAALEDASDDARSATALNAKWRPLSISIVGAVNELAQGEPAATPSP